MLKQREKYIPTKGVENEGYEFELSIISFYCFVLCYNEDIQDFKVAIYEDHYHPFDDFVIDIKINNVIEKYAIQLKHVKDKFTLNSNHFNKNGKMVLGKYFKYDFSKSNHVILLTNGVLNEELTVGNFSINKKSTLSAVEFILDSSEENKDHIYDICDKETLKKVTFFTSQKNCNDIEQNLNDKFKKIFLIKNAEDAVQKFIYFFQQWKKNCCRLDKQDIKMKIAEILFNDYIIDCQMLFGVSPKKEIKILQQVLTDVNVTIVDEIEYDLLNHLCVFDIPKEEVINLSQELLIFDQDIKSKELMLIMWKWKKIPLILEVNKDNCQVLCKLLNDLYEENLAFLLIGNVNRSYFQNQKFFENLIDLKSYKSLTQSFKISIQGQDKISLQELCEINQKILKIITLKELLLMSQGNFIAGDKEDLPQPYIVRKLSTKMLKLNSIQNFPEELFVINGSNEVLRKQFPEWKIWTFENFAILDKFPPKSIILCDENYFLTCLKYQFGNVHCLKLINSEYAELVYSNRKNPLLSNYQVFAENDLFSIVNNRINLICGSPGTGKTTMLKYLKQNSPHGFWTTKVDYKNREKKEATSTFINNLKNCFEEVKKVIYFYYGLDNLENLVDATNHILRISEDGYQVWVFCGLHQKDTFEKVFNVCAMSIQQFTEEEQKLYVQKRLGKKSKGFEKIQQNFKIFNNDNVLGAPMHLYMLTEIFINNPNSIDNRNLLIDIYQYFTETKFQHYLAKMNLNQHNQIVDDGIYYRMEQYKLAAVSCLHLNYFKNNNVKCDENFLQQIRIKGDVVGIISEVTHDGVVVFNHPTYADYFAALWLNHNLNKDKYAEMLLTHDKLKNILFLLNMEICKDNPAHLAILCQNFEQLQQHQDKVVMKDRYNRTSLHLACYYGPKYPKVVDRESLKFCIKESYTPNENSTKIIDFLITDYQLNLDRDYFNSWDILDYAFSAFNLYAIEKILSNFSEMRISAKLNEANFVDIVSIIYHSVESRFIQLLILTTKTKYFSEAISMENFEGENLLYIAVKSNKLEVVKILLNNGGDVRTKTSNYLNTSVLHLAVENNNYDIVQLLLAKGVCSDSIDRYRFTPLHVASKKGYLEIAQLLIDNTADVNCSDNFRRTPLHLAASYGHYKLLKFLLKKGANVNRSDCFGKTALNFAMEKNDKMIIENLKEAGARQEKIVRKSSNEIDDYIRYQQQQIASERRAFNWELK